MKKLIIIMALAFIAGYAQSQPLQKGSLVGVHTLTVTLKPGATMEQFEKFYITRYIPSLEQAFKGAKGKLVNARRGENENKYGIVWIFKTEKERDVFFTPDGGFSEAGNAAIKKIEPVEKELEKIATTNSVYTDWIVQ